MLRTKMLREVRNYLDSRGYMEVETPILTTIAGGANVRPFETHHNTLDLDMKLRISNELFLKRCIVGGLDRVYEMGKMFRNEGMDTRHNPEFTNIELYEAFADSDKMMEITEQMISQMAQNSLGTMIIEYQGKKFDRRRAGAGARPRGGSGVRRWGRRRRSRCSGRAASRARPGPPAPAACRWPRPSPRPARAGRWRPRRCRRWPGRRR